MQRSAFVVLVVVSLTGCLFGPKHPAPASGAVATGKPMAIVDDVKVWTTQQQENVGQDVHRDSSGNVTGVTDVYATTTKVHSKKIWYPVQGTEQISDEDFFRIVGDVGAREETRRLKARARTKLRVGHTVLAGGVVASFLGVFALRGVIIDSTTAGIGLSLGGLAAALGGFYIARSGADQLEADYHAVPRSRAELAADRYNQRLPPSPGASVSIGGQF